MLDSCLTDKEIVARADVAVKEYDKLRKLSTSKKVDDIKKQIYLTLISINILEAVRSYVSFICAFAFAENKKMVGNADIVKLIKRDEAIHLYNTQEILKILRREKSEGFTRIAKECEEDAIKMFESAAEEEKKWKYQRYIKDYLRCVASIYNNVGRLLDYLDQEGLGLILGGSSALKYRV